MGDIMDQSTVSTTILAVLGLTLSAAPVEPAESRAGPDCVGVVQRTQYRPEHALDPASFPGRRRDASAPRSRPGERVEQLEDDVSALELVPGLLIIHEPDGNQSRLVMAFAPSGRQVTLGEQTIRPAADAAPAVSPSRRGSGNRVFFGSRSHAQRLADHALTGLPRQG